METKDKLLAEISELTLKIENEYPELYVFLDEMPNTLPHEDEPDLDIEALQEYRESLKELIENHEKQH